MSFWRQTRELYRMAAFFGVILFFSPLDAVPVPPDTRITQAAWFGSPLWPAQAASPGESEALLAAMERFGMRVERDNFDAVEIFLEAFPNGAWAPALRTEMAELYYRTGWYTKAIWSLEKAWAARQAGGGAGPGGARFGHTGAKLAELYARLGKTAVLEPLVVELNHLTLGRAEQELMRGVKQGMAHRLNHPEQAYRCGALALERIRVALDSTQAGHPLIMDSRSSTQGMSLTDVAGLARQSGMSYQSAWRPAGSAWLTPAVVHLKLGHYVALLGEKKGLWHVQDPTGWEDSFVRTAALEAESSGYVLVPEGALPPGWRRVSLEEGSSVWGSNGLLDSDPDATTRWDEKKCGGRASRSGLTGAASSGMASWNVHLMLISQQVSDTPLGYTPPLGPPVYFTLRFTQRANQRFGFSPFWSHNWSGSFYEDPRLAMGNIWVQDEGGWLRFAATDEEGTVFHGQVRNIGQLYRTGRTQFEWRFPDGTKRIYTTPFATEVAYFRRFFLTAVEDAAGNRVTLQVTTTGRLESITDALGQTTRFFYELPDPGKPDKGATVPTTSNTEYTNQVTRVVDPFGRVARIDYAKVERTVDGYYNGQLTPFPYYHYDLTNITDVAGLSSRLVYDWSGSVVTNLITPYGTTSFNWTQPTEGGFSIQITHPNGEREQVSTANSLSADSDPQWTVPQGIMASYQDLWRRNVYYWDPNAFVNSDRPDTKLARVYHFQYSETLSSMGPVLESIEAPLEHRVWYNYPGQGAGYLPGTDDQPNRLARVLEDGTTQLWQWDRDAWGNIVKAVDPVGRTVSFLYATNGVDLLEVRQTRAGQNQLLGRATYNNQHRPLAITDAAGQTIRYTYNPRGQLLAVTNPRGDTTTFSYDAQGYLVAWDGPLPGAQDRDTFAYDAAGRVQSFTDRDGYTLVIDYDDLDRVTRITYPDHSTTELTYARLDLVAYKDRMSRQTRYEYDSRGRPQSITDPLQRTTWLEWCGCGHLEAVIDPLGRMTRWRRDAQGRIIAQEYADGSRISYEYERGSSRLKRTRDEQNQITEFRYDAANALTAKIHLNALKPTPDVQYTYDPDFPRVTSRVDGEGTTVFNYVPFSATPALGAGQLASVKGPWGNDEVVYTYDAAGQVTARIINGIALRLTYDPAYRLAQMTNALGAFDFTWDGGSDRLTGAHYPNGQRTEYAYQPVAKDNLLARITHWLPGGAKLSEYSYDYDASRQITQWTQWQQGTLKTWAPAYDAVYRLTGLVETRGNSPAKNFVWSYDDADNRTLAQEGADRREFAYNSLNQLISASTNVAVPGDAYEWDAENRLVAYTQGTHRVELSYDGLGRRTRITQRDHESVIQERRYLWCGPDLCEERDASGTNVIKRYFKAGMQVATGGNLAPGNYFFTRDHLGSVREVVSPQNQVIEAVEYDAFGQSQPLMGSETGDFGYAGYFRAPAGGPLLTWFRAYHPEIGRWLSRDPIREKGGLNLYAFVGNNPVNWVDPLGLQTESEGDTPEATVPGPSKWQQFLDKVEEFKVKMGEFKDKMGELGKKITIKLMEPIFGEDCDIGKMNDPAQNKREDLQKKPREGLEILKKLSKPLLGIMKDLQPGMGAEAPAMELAPEAGEVGARHIENAAQNRERTLRDTND